MKRTRQVLVALLMLGVTQQRTLDLPITVRNIKIQSIPSTSSNGSSNSPYKDAPCVSQWSTLRLGPLPQPSST